MKKKTKKQTKLLPHEEITKQGLKMALKELASPYVICKGDIDVDFNYEAGCYEHSRPKYLSKIIIINLKIYCGVK